MPRGHGIRGSCLADALPVSSRFTERPPSRVAGLLRLLGPQSLPWIVLLFIDRYKGCMQATGNTGPPSPQGDKGMKV